MPRTAQFIPQQVIQDIQKATQEILVEESFDGVTVRKICQRANISTGTFYQFYKSKSQVLAEVVDYLECYFKTQVLPTLTGTGINKLEMWFIAYINKVTESGINYCRKSQKFMYEGSLNSEKRKQLYIYQLLYVIIDECKQEKSINENIDNDIILQMLFYYVEGLVFDWCYLDGTFDIHKMAQTTFPLFIKSFQ